MSGHAETSRLNPTDEMLWRAAADLGSARIVQLAWWFPDPLTEEQLQQLWQHIDAGRLSRTARRASVPGARREWAPTRNRQPGPLLSAQQVYHVHSWLDEQIRQPLTVELEVLWRLVAAPYAGGTLVSLCVPHFRSDGHGIFLALSERQPVAEGELESAGVASVRRDLVDAVRTGSSAVVQTVRWLASAPADPAQLTAVWHAVRRRPAPRSQQAEEAPRFFHSSYLAVNAAAWRDRAVAHGGTSNSLFVEIAANMIRHAAADRDAVRVGIPMDLRRSPADTRANALVVVPVPLPAGPARYGSLAQTRELIRAALVASGDHSSTLVPAPLWQLLPASARAKLKTPGAQQTDVVASNFGVAPKALLRVGDRDAGSLWCRTMNVPGLVPGRAALRASLCLLEVGDQVMLTVTGIPDYYPDEEALQRLVIAELAGWGLTAQPVWPAAAVSSQIATGPASTGGGSNR